MYCLFVSIAFHSFSIIQNSETSHIQLFGKKDFSRSNQILAILKQHLQTQSNNFTLIFICSQAPFSNSIRVQHTISITKIACLMLIFLNLKSIVRNLFSNSIQFQHTVSVICTVKSRAVDCLGQQHIFRRLMKEKFDAYVL